MDPTVRTVLERLTEAAAAHDAGQPNRLDRWRVLEPDAGRLVWFLAQSVRARNIVEIGTSRGVSTLWLADAARETGGRVHTIDTDAAAQAEARGTVAEAGLSNVDFTTADGGAALRAIPDGTVDLLFLDAERTEYPGWWPHPVRVLREGGVLVVDNALSHPDEIAPFQSLLAADPTLTVTTIPVGKGELVALRPIPPHRPI